MPEEGKMRGGICIPNVLGISFNPILNFPFPCYEKQNLILGNAENQRTNGGERHLAKGKYDDDGACTNLHGGWGEAIVKPTFPLRAT